MLTGCSRLESKTERLYRYLGIEDKNNNGLIESDEKGYDARADLNKDGDIKQAELRYYLHYILNNVDERIEKENPLTNEDKKEITADLCQKLQETKTAFSHSYDRSEAILGIVSKMITIGLFQQALEATKSIEHPEIKSQALFDIASFMEAAGMKKEAIDILHQVLETASENFLINNKVKILAKIASNLSMIGKRAEATRYFKRALERENADDVAEVSIEMANAGLFKEALDTIKNYEEGLYIKSDFDIYNKTNAILGIALEMAKAGLKNDASKMFEKALVVIDKTKKQYEKLDKTHRKWAEDDEKEKKAILYSCIAENMAEAGLKKEAKKVLKQARRTAEAISDNNAVALSFVAEGFARLGLKRQAINMFKDALKSEEKSIDLDYSLPPQQGPGSRWTDFAKRECGTIQSNMFGAGLTQYEINKLFEEFRIRRFIKDIQ